MALLLTGLTHERPATLNADSPSHPQDAADRTTRHMRMCAELADLAMQLARETAKSALAALAEPETQAAPEPLPAPPSEPVPARATPRAAAGLCLRAPACKPMAPALVFIRLANLVRDLIALEASLAATLAPTSRPNPTRPDPNHADPRRAPLGDFLHHVTERLPNRAQQRREATTRLDDILAADLDRTMKTPAILTTICDELGIEIHLPTLPDAYLDLLIDPDEADEDPPDPHATSPP